MKLIESFFYGIIAALGALIAELFVFIGISSYQGFAAISFSDFFIVPYFIVIAVCIEEIMKYLFIAKRSETLQDKSSPFMNSLIIGLGFFAVELAFLLANGTGSPTKQFLAEIAIVHIGTAGIVGIFATFGSLKKLSVFAPAFFLAILFHGSYNFLALNRDYAENYMIFAILGILVLANLAGFFSKKALLARD